MNKKISVNPVDHVYPVKNETKNIRPGVTRSALHLRGRRTGRSTYSTAQLDACAGFDQVSQRAPRG